MPSPSARPLRAAIPLEYVKAQGRRIPSNYALPPDELNPALQRATARTLVPVTTAPTWASALRGVHSFADLTAHQQTMPKTLNTPGTPVTRSRSTSGETPRTEDTHVTAPTAEPVSPKEQPAETSTSSVEQQAPASTPTPSHTYTMNFGSLSFECGNGRRSRMLDTQPAEQQEFSDPIFNDSAVLTLFPTMKDEPILRNETVTSASINGVREGDYTTIFFGQDRYVRVRNDAPQPPMSSFHPVAGYVDKVDLDAMFTEAIRDFKAHFEATATEQDVTPVPPTIPAAPVSEVVAPVCFAASKWAPQPESAPVDASSPVEVEGPRGLAASKWAPSHELAPVPASESQDNASVASASFEHASAVDSAPSFTGISVTDAYDVVAVDPVPAAGNVNDHSSTDSALEVTVVPLIDILSFEERVSVDADDKAFIDDALDFEVLLDVEPTSKDVDVKSLHVATAGDEPIADEVSNLDEVALVTASGGHFSNDGIEPTSDGAENEPFKNAQAVEQTEEPIVESTSAPEGSNTSPYPSSTLAVNRRAPVRMPGMSSYAGRSTNWADDDEDDDWFDNLQSRIKAGEDIFQPIQAPFNDVQEYEVADEQEHEVFGEQDQEVYDDQDQEIYDEHGYKVYEDEELVQEAVVEFEQENTSEEPEEGVAAEEIALDIACPDANCNIPISTYQVLGCALPPLQQSVRGQCIEYYGNASIELFEPDTLYEDRIKTLCLLAGWSEDERMEAAHLLMHFRKLQFLKQQFWNGRQAIIMDHLSGIPDTDEDPNFSLRELAIAKAELLIPASLRTHDPGDITLEQYIWAVGFPNVCADFVSINLHRDPDGDWYAMEEVSREMEISAPGIAGTPMYYCFESLLEDKNLRTQDIITDINRRFCLMRGTVLNLRPMIARMESHPQWQVVMKKMMADDSGKFCKQPVITLKETVDQLLEQGTQFRRGYPHTIQKGTFSTTLYNLNEKYPHGRTSAVIHKVLGKSPLSPPGIILVAGRKYGSTICLRDGQTLPPRSSPLLLSSGSTEDGEMRTDSEASSTPQLSTSASDNSLPFFAMDDFPEPAESEATNGDHDDNPGDDILSDDDPFLFDTSSDHENTADIGDDTDVVQLSPAVTIRRPGQLRRKKVSSELAVECRTDSPTAFHPSMERGRRRQLRVFSDEELLLEEDEVELPSSPPRPASPVEAVEVSTPSRIADAHRPSFMTSTLPELDEDAQTDAKGSMTGDASDDVPCSSPYVDTPEHMPLSCPEAEAVTFTPCLRLKPRADSDATVSPVDSGYESPVRDSIADAIAVLAIDNIHARDFALEVTHPQIKRKLDDLVSDLNPIRPVMDDAEFDDAVSIPPVDDEYKLESEVSVPPSPDTLPVFSIFSGDAEDGILDFLFAEGPEDAQEPEVTDQTTSDEQKAFTPLLFGNLLDIEEREEPIAFLFADLLEEDMMEVMELDRSPVVVVNNTDDLVAAQLALDLMATLEEYATEVETLPAVEDTGIETIDELCPEPTSTEATTAPLSEFGPFVPGACSHSLAVLDLPDDGKFGGLVYLAGLMLIAAALW